MRRKDREVTDTGEICAILDTCQTCYVGMLDGMEPYFHSAAEGRKMDIWKREQTVCFAVGTEGALRAAPSPCGYGYAYSSVMGRGVLEFIENAADKCRALEILFRHQTGKSATFTAQQAEAVCVYKIVCGDFTAKSAQ